MDDTIPLSHFLVLGALLFSLGVFGVLVRRNALVVFMCVELMLNASNLTFLAFARDAGVDSGHLPALFVIAVAAAEASIGLLPELLRRLVTLRNEVKRLVLPR